MSSNKHNQSNLMDIDDEEYYGGTVNNVNTAAQPLTQPHNTSQVQQTECISSTYQTRGNCESRSLVQKQPVNRRLVFSNKRANKDDGCADSKRKKK